MTTDSPFVAAPNPPPKRKTEAPSPNTKPKEMTQAEKYQLAYVQAFSSLPKWKQLAIKEEEKAGRESRFVQGFLKEVTRLAEL